MLENWKYCDSSEDCNQYKYMDWASDNNGGCHVLQGHKEQFDQD